MNNARPRKFQSLAHYIPIGSGGQELTDLEYSLPTIQIYILSEYHIAAPRPSPPPPCSRE
jgi:hypothetical protein